MLAFLKAKAILVALGVIGLLTVTGAATAYAVHQEIGPFAANNSGQHADATATKQPDPSSAQHEHEVHIQGMIITVAYDKGTVSSGSFVIAPDDHTAQVTVHFNQETHVTSAGAGTQAKTATGMLAPGLSVNTEAVQDANGTILAKSVEVKPADKAKGNEKGNMVNLQGDIQSVNAGTFALKVGDKVYTLAFDGDTKIAIDDATATPVLVVGLHVEVAASTRSDGTLYARSLTIHSTSGDPNSPEGTPTTTPDPHKHQPPTGTPTPHH